jgi:hypothetical protein
LVEFSVTNGERQISDDDDQLVRLYKELPHVVFQGLQFLASDVNEESLQVRLQTGIDLEVGKQYFGDVCFRKIQRWAIDYDS